MKKGFTLVELLGVVVVLSIVLILSVPSIINTFRRANQNDYEAYLQTLFTAAENHIELNRGYFDQLNDPSGEVYLSINTLRDLGLITQRGIDPETGDNLDEEFTIVVKQGAGGQLDYSFVRLRKAVDTYLQDGLIMHYDALNNNGIGFRRNHYFEDLSASNNDIMSIDSERWTVNSLMFSGVGDHLSSTRDLIPNILSDTYTIEIVLKQTGTSQTRIGFEEGPFLQLSSSSPIWNFGGSTQGYGASYSRGDKYRFALSNNSNTNNSVIYLNDLSSGVSNSAELSEPSKFVIGTDYHPFVGELYAIRVYNRNLSMEELNSNYEVDVNRFGF